MRVNHVGEVCAQALYQAQALTARSEALREQMLAAAREEVDHLAWTEARLKALGDRPSLLNPRWFAGAFAIGLAAWVIQPAWVSWSRPSARWKPTWPATWSACPQKTPNPAPSSRR